jgi:hypothetical protein
MGLIVVSLILGVLSIIIGLVGIVIGALILYLSMLAGTLLIGLGTAVFVCGILEIVYIVGFFEGWGWSWTLAMVVATVCLVSSTGLIGLSTIAIPDDTIALFVISVIRLIAIVPVITSSVTIYILTRSQVKAFFGKNDGAKSPRPDEAAIDASTNTSPRM